VCVWARGLIWNRQCSPLVLAAQIGKLIGHVAYAGWNKNTEYACPADRKRQSTVGHSGRRTEFAGCSCVLRLYIRQVGMASVDATGGEKSALKMAGDVICPRWWTAGCREIDPRWHTPIWGTRPQRRIYDDSVRPAHALSTAVSWRSIRIH